MQKCEYEAWNDEISVTFLLLEFSEISSFWK